RARLLSATQGGGSTGPVARAKGRKPFAPDGGRAPLVELEAPARAARSFRAIAGDDRPGSATVLGKQRFFTARAGAGTPAGATRLQLVEATAYPRFLRGDGISGKLSASKQDCKLEVSSLSLGGGLGNSESALADGVAG